MKIIKADHSRRLQLEGVRDPVARPVDIDRTQTGFDLLRSLRIYRFGAGSVIDGHAEADEVLIMVLAGSIELTLSERDMEEVSPQFHLSAVDNPDGGPCAAYLPPNGAYRLIARGEAEVAYARATPSHGRAPTVFSAGPRSEKNGGVVLFEETTYAQHLRLRVVQVTGTPSEGLVSPVESTELDCETLVHVRTEPTAEAVKISTAGTDPIAVESWDTVALEPGERPTLRVAVAASALLLVVFASA